MQKANRRSRANQRKLTVSRRRRAKPTPPFRKQRLRRPGLESELEPKPQFEARDYRSADKLRDRVALITGGDSGIGRAVAVLYAREGADVAIVYLNEDDDAEETRRLVEAEGRRALLLRGDVADFAFCRKAVERTVKELGHLDILVNNAAYEEHADSVDELSVERWDRTFRTNIYGYFYMAKAAQPYLKAGSAIVNTGSITGFRGHKQLLDYSAAKGAIHTFTKSLAQMLVDKGIRVNAVAPGPVWTPLIASDFPESKVAEFGADRPFGRPAQPEEIAPAYVFLASNADSSYITGDVLPILGGETIG